MRWKNIIKHGSSQGSRIFAVGQLGLLVYLVHVPIVVFYCSGLLPIVVFLVHVPIVAMLLLKDLSETISSALLILKFSSLSLSLSLFLLCLFLFSFKTSVKHFKGGLTFMVQACSTINSFCNSFPLPLTQFCQNTSVTSSTCKLARTHILAQGNIIARA